MCELLRLFVCSTDDIEYTTVSGGMSDPPTATTNGDVVISGEGEMYVGGPLDMPGATVEIVETEPFSVSTPQRRPLVKKKPEFREQLLLRLVLLH